MAINYTKIGWDTSKYVNPTNMNQMDDGIKAACDGVDGISGNYMKLSGGLQVLTRTDTGSSTAFAIKSALPECLTEFIDGNNAGLGYFGVKASKTPVYIPFGSSIRGQISVVGKNAAHAYTATSGSSYAKIKINSTEAWMLSFRVRVYSGYATDEYIIGGYNYASTKRWYSPTAILVNSSGSAKKVIFGYDGDSELWVAVPTGAYRACDVIDVVNASAQLDTSDLFSITWVDEANLSTVQTSTTVSPLAEKTDIPTDYVKLSTSSAQTIITTNTSTRVALNLQASSTTPPLLGFRNSSGTTLGYFGVSADAKPIFRSVGGSDAELLQLDTLKSVVAASTDFANFKTRIAAL